MGHCDRQKTNLLEVRRVSSHLPFLPREEIPHSLANNDSSATLVIDIPATGSGVVKFPVRSRLTFLNILLPPTCAVVNLVASRVRGKRQTVGHQPSEAPRAKEIHCATPSTSVKGNTPVSHDIQGTAKEIQPLL